MTTIGDVETSLRSIYGKKWRHGLLVHILIGLGRSIVKRDGDSSDTICGEPWVSGESEREGDNPIAELHGDPLEYVRPINGKLARELETQLLRMRRGPVTQDTPGVFPNFGELLEAIGVQAKLRLEGNGREELSELLEAVIQVSWEEAPLILREDVLRIIRLVSLFTASIPP